MPKNGYKTITITDNDAERLLRDAEDILEDSPIKANDLSSAEQLRLVLDKYEEKFEDPEEES